MGELPMMFYTAVNYRPYLPPPPPNTSFLFLAVGYFNIILPSSLPSTTTTGLGIQNTFWHRARSARQQSRAHLRNEMLPCRTLIMSEERGKRARRFAAEDDGFLSRPTPTPSSPSPSTPTPSPSPNPSPKPPSLALLGLSQMGSLDPLYTPTSYPSLTLTSMRATTRKAPGGMLLFTWTFRGRLYLSLGWDRGGV